MNNIEKLVTEPIFVLEKHVKQFQTKKFTQDASDCVLSEQDLTLLSDKYHL